MSTTEASPTETTYDIVNPDEMDWIAVEPPGNFLKPIRLSADGEWALLAKLAKGCVEPRHRHIGSFSNFVISGSIEIYGQKVTAGSWMLERDGAIHDGVTALEDSVAYLEGKGGGAQLLTEDDEVILEVDYVAWIKSLIEDNGLNVAT